MVGRSGLAVTFLSITDFFLFYFIFFFVNTHSSPFFSSLRVSVPTATLLLFYWRETAFSEMGDLFL